MHSAFCILHCEQLLTKLKLEAQKMTAERRSFFLSKAFFQGLGGQAGLVDPGHAVLHGQDIAFGQVVPGDHLAFLLRPLQKFPAPGGDGGTFL